MSMRRIQLVIGPLLGLASVLAMAPAAWSHPRRSAPARNSLATSAVTATNTLGLDLLSRLNPQANVVASPFSIETALAMIDQGASPATARQLLRALGGVPSVAALSSSNRVLGSDLHSAVTAYGAGGPTLNSANGLWVQKGLTLKSSFSQALGSDFGAAAQVTDFAGDPDGAVQAINRWVSQRTNGLIPNLVNSSVVNSSTSLFLANAVYLHANWTRPFDASQTENAAFSTTSGSVQVPFMNQSSSYPYAATSRYRAIALNYTHSSLQYVAVMPPTGQIASLQRWLTVPRLNSLTASLHSTVAELSMPKFTLSLNTSLNGFLQQLGMSDIFNANGLTNMVVGQPLQVSEVVHDATLQVAEKGTVAAAATGVAVTTSAAPAPDRVVVDLNHPFLVFIRDVKTGAVLFAARVMDPSSAS